MIQPLTEDGALCATNMKEEKVPVDQQAFQSWQCAFLHFHFFLIADYIDALCKRKVLSHSGGITVRF